MQPERIHLLSGFRFAGQEMDSLGKNRICRAGDDVGWMKTE